MGQKYFKTRFKVEEARTGTEHDQDLIPSWLPNTYEWGDLHSQRCAVADDPCLVMPFSVPCVRSLPPSAPPPAPRLANYHLMFSICTIGATVLPDLTGMRVCPHV